MSFEKHLCEMSFLFANVHVSVLSHCNQILKQTNNALSNISDYTNLSRYITPVQSKPDSPSLPSPARIQNTMMQDWRTKVGCVCMPTFLWHAANVGSHRNPANCSVGKEVVLTSCKNVTLLCSCGRDLIHTYTHCWKISHLQTSLKSLPYMNFFKWFNCDCGCYQASLGCTSEESHISWMSTASLHYIQMRCDADRQLENHLKSFHSRIFLFL